MKRKNIKVTKKFKALLLAVLMTASIGAANDVTTINAYAEEDLFTVTEENQEEVNGNDGVQYEDVKEDDKSNVVDELPSVDTTTNTNTDTNTNTGATSGSSDNSSSNSSSDNSSSSSNDSTTSNETSEFIDEDQNWNPDTDQQDEIPDTVKTEKERKGIEDEPTEPEPTEPEPTQPEPTTPDEDIPKMGVEDYLPKMFVGGGILAAIGLAIAEANKKRQLLVASGVKKVTSARKSSSISNKTRNGKRR